MTLGVKSTFIVFEITSECPATDDSTVFGDRDALDVKVLSRVFAASTLVKHYIIFWTVTISVPG